MATSTKLAAALGIAMAMAGCSYFPSQGPTASDVMAGGDSSFNQGRRAISSPT